MKFTIMDTKRTNNFNDPDIKQKIKSLWKENTSSINDAKRQGLTIASVYYDYESNYKSDYSISLCKESNSNADFDTAKYHWKEYKVNPNDKTSIPKTWNKIWNDEKKHLIKRVYDFDFEQYKPDGKITIFVAIY
ncbi:transcriptional regulator [Lactobacillus acetotolerans]|uniref:Uncharacterized protein n=1 Tax=Lactobacillus acetotolerans TaxID=1600 RepID=A0A0D6A302_9LACO|nr:transcriptional regulator [Lactobacillus acetotolerans]MBN7277131.1 transcriptional regulator [Lactobacillus acetotolerans]BAQ57126.1 conserved hypothetical protein [Lactobacillus acetotolerans]HBQ43193.1 transcriptional regulator [Lactobacillus acetotolerans]